MNDPFSGFVGVFILLASAFLFWLGGVRTNPDSPRQDEAYWRSRLRRRHWISAMLAAVGACAIGAGFYGHGYAWMLLWAVTPIFLFGMICVAGIDAFLTSQHFQKRFQSLSKQASQKLEQEIASKREANK